MKNFTVLKTKINSIKFGFLSGDFENICHEKILPVLSVVQAIKGSYDIQLGNSEMFNTGEGGVFIAPANILQKITHHNGENNVMIAQWVFIDIVVNDAYKFDDIFSFPVVLDKKYNVTIGKLIKTIGSTENYFEKHSAVYKLLSILSAEGQIKDPSDTVKTQIENYVREHFSENIKATDIAKVLYCSVSQVFKYTHKYFGLSPANFVNNIRLQQAEFMLLNTKKKICDIGFSVGFSDIIYFNKLFKQHYGCSPSLYKRKFSELNTTP